MLLLLSLLLLLLLQLLLLLCCPSQVPFFNCALCVSIYVVDVVVELLKRTPIEDDKCGVSASDVFAPKRWGGDRTKVWSPFVATIIENDLNLRPR